MARPNLKSRNRMPACFAPPLTDELLARYEELTEALPDSRGEVRDAMRECLRAVKLWWELDESPGSPRDPSLLIMHRRFPWPAREPGDSEPDPSLEQRREIAVKVVSLTKELQEELFDAIPWEYELLSMGGQTVRTPDGEDTYFPGIFDSIDRVSDKELFDAASHLLWYCKELCNDREPLTQAALG